MTCDQIDDALWSALGDPTRRRLIDALLDEGVATATSLATRLPMSRQAVSKQLAVLDRAGLVTITPAGREMRYRIDDAQLDRAVAQFIAVRDAWDTRLRHIKQIAERVQASKQPSGA